MARKHETIRRRGNVLLYIAIAMVAFTGFASLGIDFSHILLVRNELQFAADSSARYAMAGLATSVSQAQTNAVTAASEMYADGSKVVVTPGTDVIFGTWSGGTFTTLTGSAQSSANAVRVICRRTSALGNPVSLIFAKFVGMNTADIIVTSIAAGVVKPTGIVGISGASMSGSAFVNSYDSSTSGAYSPGAANNNAPVISNQNITMSGSAEVFGNASPGPGYSVSGGIVTGSRASQSSAGSYPAPSAGSAATTNNDSSVSTWVSNGSFNTSGNTTATMPGGTYYFTDFTMSGNSTLNITGPVVIYVTGKLDLSGSVDTAQSIPKNLQIYVTSTQNSSFSGQSDFYGQVYAPLSNVTVSGQSGFNGSVVGASLTISGSGGVHYDQSLASGTSGISTVQ